MYRVIFKNRRPKQKFLLPRFHFLNYAHNNANLHKYPLFINNIEQRNFTKLVCKIIDKFRFFLIVSELRHIYYT